MCHKNYATISGRNVHISEKDVYGVKGEYSFVSK
jgi:hypothetical protein